LAAPPCPNTHGSLDTVSRVVSRQYIMLFLVMWLGMSAVIGAG
jgi:hypothetical protein